MSTHCDKEQATSILGREIAELDVQMNAKESFASRIGLLPFAAGAIAAITALMIFQFASHF